MLVCKYLAQWRVPLTGPVREHAGRITSKRSRGARRDKVAGQGFGAWGTPGE